MDIFEWRSQEEALFEEQGSLVCVVRKPCLKSKEALFANHCCPVKKIIYGFREAGPLCETHCKPQGGAAVGGQWCKGQFPEGGLMPLAVSRMCKSRFAEHYPLIQLYPQLRRSAACSGFRIEVYLRHTPCALNQEWYISSNPANFKFYAICLIKESYNFLYFFTGQ